MIYSLYEKFIEISERYKLLDYLTYIIFFIFVLFSSLAVVVFAKDKFSLTNNNFIYVIDKSYDGNISLPDLNILCPSNDITIAFDTKVQGYKNNTILDISLYDPDNDTSSHELIRLSNNTEVVVNYSKQLGDMSLQSLIGLVTTKYPYQATRQIKLNGEFATGMTIEVNNFSVRTDDNKKCEIYWQIMAN